MAQVTEVTLVDDLDGGKADETVTFAIDGKSFEIDLSAAHASELRDALCSFISAARSTGPGGGQPRQARAGAAPMKSREENAAIRRWAQENGFQVSERGRLPSTVVMAYANRGATAQMTAVAEEKPKRRSRVKASDAA
jgi:hypothetical protein